jgi:DNA-binding transcriptional LysR family regulator
MEVVVIAMDPDTPPPLEDLRADLLFDGRLLVAVPADHRLARRGVVNVDELEHEPWIVGDAGGGDPLLGVWPGASGAPTIAYAIRDWPARLGLVAAGLGLAVVPSVAAAAMPPKVHLIGVNDPRPVWRSVLAVTRRERSPSAAALITALHEEGALIVEATLRAMSA